MLRVKTSTTYAGCFNLTHTKAELYLNLEGVGTKAHGIENHNLNGNWEAGPIAANCSLTVTGWKWVNETYTTYTSIEGGESLVAHVPVGQNFRCS